jgi:ABC-2 type transport system permease protein
VSRRYRSAALSIAWRQVHNMLRNPALIVPALIFPLFFFAANAGGMSALSNVPGFDYPDYNTFTFVFVLLQSAAFGGVFTGFSIAADFEYGLGRRFMLATPHRSALIGGYILSAMARTLLTWTVVFTVALAAGMTISGGPIDLLPLILLALIVNVAGTLFGGGIALRFRTLQAGPMMQIPVFLLLMTAPVYVPREFLEGWVHSVSGFNPFTVLLDTGRGLIIGEPLHVAAAFAIAAGLAALLVVFGMRGMRRAEADA